MAPEQQELLREIRIAISEHFEMERSLSEQRLVELFNRACTCPLKGTDRRQHIGRILDAIEDLGDGAGIPGGISTIRRHHTWLRGVIQTTHHYKTLVITAMVLTFLGACGTLIMGWGKLTKILNGG